jgi:hypothetical protein
MAKKARPGAAEAKRNEQTGSAAAAENKEPSGTSLVQRLLHETLSSLKLPSALMQRDLWLSMSRGGLTVSELPCSATSSVSGDHHRSQEVPCSAFAGKSHRIKQDIVLAGYTQVAALPWMDLGVSLRALSDTIDALHAAGYPPVFILMYDQAWLLCERLFPLMEALMGPEVALDTSIFAWSLRRATPLRTTSTTRKASSEAHSSKESTATHAIGDNFGVPHRDSRYSDCHTVEGQPTEISCWLPLVDVTPDSGCMLVVPAQHDPLFAASNHPLHMKPTEAMPWAHIRALPAAAGDILLWKANLIHWGSSCGSFCDREPRKSIAMAFMLPTASCEPGSSGRLSRADLQAGLSLMQRVKIVTRSLLQYEHWHPTFAGFAPSVVDECLASMSFR